MTRRLWWAGPLALVFDAERPDSFDWLAWGGIPVLSGTHDTSDGYLLSGFVGAGVDARLRLSERHTLNASLSELGAFEWTQQASPHRSWPETYTTQLTLGISETIPGAATFDFGVGTSANLLIDGRFAAAPLDSTDRNVVIARGSVQRARLRPLPLIHVAVGRGWAWTRTRSVRTYRLFLTRRSRRSGRRWARAACGARGLSQGNRKLGSDARSCRACVRQIPLKHERWGAAPDRGR